MKTATNKTDRVWRALADPIRRSILDILSSGPRTTGELVEQMDDLCRTGVMKHLDVLENAGLLIVKRDGRVRWNHFNPVPIDQVCRRWLDRRSMKMSSALSRLKNVVES